MTLFYLNIKLYVIIIISSNKMREYDSLACIGQLGFSAVVLLSDLLRGVRRGNHHGGDHAALLLADAAGELLGGALVWGRSGPGHQDNSERRGHKSSW